MLCCMVVVGIQQRQIAALNASIATLREDAQQTVQERLPLETMEPEDSRTVAGDEIKLLRETALQLKAEVTELARLKQQNEEMRVRLATTPGNSTEEGLALATAKERAQAIQCVNHLKQVGLAARIWAGDNEDRYPKDIVTMSNELSTPRILICPADGERRPATDFASFTAANVSYEWSSDPPASEIEPARVLTRCPFHGTVGLADGSVHLGAAKEHPEWFVQRDGKLFMERSPAAQER